MKLLKSPEILFVSVLFLLLSALSPGNIPGDTAIRWSVARQLAQTGSAHIEDHVATRYHAQGLDGKRYSFWGIGQSLLFYPFAQISRLLQSAAGINPKTADLFAQFLISVFLFPAIATLGTWAFYRLLLQMGYSRYASFVSAGLLAVATMMLHYGVCTHEQSQVALLLILALWCLVKNRKSPGFIYAWCLCLALGIGLMFRISSVVMALPIFLTASIQEVTAASRNAKMKCACKWLSAGILGTGIFVVFLLWQNYTRFGSIFENGYGIAAKTMFGGTGAFESSPLQALCGMLFSPGKSIVLYNPLLLLIPFVFFGFAKTHKTVTIAALGAIIGNMLFNSFHTTWAGDYAWSCRYQAAVLPLLALPLVELFQNSMKPFRRAVVIAVICISTAIQFSSVLYSFSLEFIQNPNHTMVPGQYIWDIKQSHLLKRFTNIYDHATGRQSFESVPVIQENRFLLQRNHSPENVRKAYAVNFYPFKARVFGVSKTLYLALLTLWAGTVAAMICLMAPFLKALKTLRDEKL